MRDPEGIGIPVEVEAGDGREAHTRVELGPRRPGEDLDRVTQCHELAGQVTGVHALAATARVPPIGEVRDAPAPATRWGRGNRGGHLKVARPLPGLFGLDPLLAGSLRQWLSRLDPWRHSLPERPGSAQTAPPGESRRQAATEGERPTPAAGAKIQL